ncbi:MAG: hypothetical protein JOZ24_10080, partial [Candidatus Eremiobacteraeota bacterium]|nr:hypothetical protein [Candidatus Eremiobacteraeota bacterium]
IVAGAFTNATKAKTPFVSVTIAPYAASFRGQREITIGGQGFAHGEGVRFFVRVDTYDDVPLGGRPSGETSQQFELYTQADGAGNFTLPLPGIFDVVCDGRPRSYHVYATGATSGTTSNGATVSCRWPDPASGDPVGARVPHPGATASE